MRGRQKFVEVGDAVRTAELLKEAEPLSQASR